MHPTLLTPDSLLKLLTMIADSKFATALIPLSKDFQKTETPVSPIEAWAIEKMHWGHICTTVKHAFIALNIQ